MKAEENVSDMMLWKFDENELFSCLDLNDTVFPEANSQETNYSKAGYPEKQVPRHKRHSHIKAELKRRGKIKTGFHDLETLVPAIECKADSKSTKLNKAADYCRKLQNDKKQLQQKVILLKNEVELLSHQICECQMQLPPSGVLGEVKPPKNVVPKESFDKMFDDYVKSRTQENWKFWIFSKIMRPMFDSYVSSVEEAKPTDLVERGINWADNHCQLPTLRKDAFMALRQISKSTSIMTNPELVSTEVMKAACYLNVPAPPDVVSETATAACTAPSQPSQDMLPTDAPQFMCMSPSTNPDLLSNEVLQALYSSLDDLS